MRRVMIAAAAACAVTGGLLLATAEDASAKRAAKCVMMSAKGAGLGEVMAKGFAADALADNQALRGLKGQGKVSYKCDAAPVTTCTASQRACGAPKKA